MEQGVEVGILCGMRILVVDVSGVLVDKEVEEKKQSVVNVKDVGFQHATVDQVV